MYLSTVEIKNFRSLKNLTVNFQPGLNVLVGRNNTGKTNLLKAIRHALGPSASRGDSLWLDEDDFYRESADDEADCTISITLIFEGLSEAQRSYFFEIVDFDLEDIEKSKAIIRFEATWSKGKRLLPRRTGGPQSKDAQEVPANLLQSLPITFLPALRDAESSLAAGNRSRLAMLLRDLAARSGDKTETDVKRIFAKANSMLEKRPLISTTKESLQSTTKDLAGIDHRPSSIRATEVKFEKILRSLQIQMADAPIAALDANGDGYNNLLYIAVVLEHLKSPHPDECPLLLVEEPEAHLHPQLTLLLADYLANRTPGEGAPQTIVTTHSPTLAASVRPSCLQVMFTDIVGRQPQCNSLKKADLSPVEERSLQRMMDVTRATLYFAKGAILVEGISEALLLPVMAKRLNFDLAKLHISVIPICGVAFETFKKLLSPDVLGIPVAIITDADPPVPTDVAWKDALPETENGAFKLSDRTKKLGQTFAGHPTVKVFNSKLTLEYDLAAAGDMNAHIMAGIWEDCFDGKPGTFNKEAVKAAGTGRDEMALVTWRGICRAKHSGSKAEFAHHLAAYFDDTTGPLEFAIPQYLQDAILYVTGGFHESANT